MGSKSVKCTLNQVWSSTLWYQHRRGWGWGRRIGNVSPAWGTWSPISEDKGKWKRNASPVWVMCTSRIWLCQVPTVSGAISSLPCLQGNVLWGCVQRQRWGEWSKHKEIPGKTSGAWDLSHSPGKGEEVTFQPIPLTRTWCIFYRPHDSALNETLKPWSPTALGNLPRCKMTFLLDH